MSCNSRSCLVLSSFLEILYLAAILLHTGQEAESVSWFVRMFVLSVIQLILQVLKQFINKVAYCFTSFEFVMKK